jgi:predicted DNA-binding protein (MmcQ/YjbR family)
MTRGAEVPERIVDRLRSICADLPEAREEEAWTGTRWRVGQQTFAHLVAIADGWPPVYARAAGTDGPAVVLTFQSSGEELQALSNVGHPYFRPPWRPGIVGMLVDDANDWDEVAELVTESYCLLAPQRLVERVARPPDA